MGERYGRGHRAARAERKSDLFGDKAAPLQAARPHVPVNPARMLPAARTSSHVKQGKAPWLENSGRW
jgi:hypothetical protein